MAILHLFFSRMFAPKFFHYEKISVWRYLNITEQIYNFLFS